MVHEGRHGFALVQGPPGTGKSTVLREYAAMRPHLRCLYLTFNKEVAWLGLGLGLGLG